MSPKFEYMITYLEYPLVARAGNSETLYKELGDKWRKFVMDLRLLKDN
jgi:hypothetical protein